MAKSHIKNPSADNATPIKVSGVKRTSPVPCHEETPIRKKNLVAAAPTSTKDAEKTVTGKKQARRPSPSLDSELVAKDIATPDRKKKRVDTIDHSGAGIKAHDAAPVATRRAFHSAPVADHLTTEPQAPGPQNAEDRHPVGTAVVNKRVGRAPVAKIHKDKAETVTPVASRRAFHSAPVADHLTANSQAVSEENVRIGKALVSTKNNAFSSVIGASGEQATDKVSRLRQAKQCNSSSDPAAPSKAASKSSAAAPAATGPPTPRERKLQQLNGNSLW